MKPSQKQLFKIYKKYINIPIYRVVSSEYLPSIKKEGLNPKKDPFEKIKPDIKKLFRLLLSLEKKGFIHEQDWGFKKVSGKYIVMVSLEDLNSPYIDFTTNYKETSYYLKHPGGALVQTIKKITLDILERKPKLSKKDLLLVKKLNIWANNKSKFKNKILIVKGSSKAFETALFQHRLGKKVKDKYWPSPFGSFEHFQKIINKYSFEKYKPCLVDKKSFYLRVINKIPKEDIKILN